VDSSHKELGGSIKDGHGGSASKVCSKGAYGGSVLFGNLSMDIEM
jgi:hypothetical protein